MSKDVISEAMEARPRLGPCADSRGIAFSVFNTEIALTAYGEDCAALDEALALCRDRCVLFERLLSRTRADSDIARIRSGAPQAVPVAPETADVIRVAQRYCERSHGVFDITMGSVTSLWDFHAGVVPSKLSIARALEHVDYRKIHVCDLPDGSHAVRLSDPESSLDVGGIAKGYVADDLAALLRERAIDRFALNLGGNVMLAGGDLCDPSDLRPWRVGIIDPFRPDAYRAVVEIESGSVATSGAHERRFTRGGVSYHHILSPEDGMPARTDVASVSVVAPRSVDCDGYSTTLFMLGVEGGLAYAERTEGIDAIVIDDRGGVQWTSGLDGRVAPVG